MGEHEPRQVPGQGVTVDPVHDEVGQHVPELLEYRPEYRNDENEGQEARVEDFPDRGRHYLPDPAGTGDPWINFLIREQPEQVQRDQHGAPIEDHGPGVAIEKMRQRRAQEGADVDHHIKKTPAYPGGLIREGPDKGSLNGRLEDRGSRGQQQAAGKERPKGTLAGHQQVSQSLQDNGHHDLFLVAVAVGETAADHRQGRLHQGPPQEDEALIALGKMESADLVRLGNVYGDDHPHAIIGEPLDRLHDVGHPKRPGQAPGLPPERRGLRLLPRVLAAPVVFGLHRHDGYSCQLTAMKWIEKFLGWQVIWKYCLMNAITTLIEMIKK